MTRFDLRHARHPAPGDVAAHWSRGRVLIVSHGLTSLVVEVDDWAQVHVVSRDGPVGWLAEATWTSF